MAVDFLHEGRNLLVVHVGLHNLVHHLVELLGADFLWGGDGAGHKLLADDPLNLTHLVALTGVDDGDGGTFLAGASRTPASVGIALDIIGQAEVDDVGQVVYVESAGGHVGGYEQLGEVVAEFLHRQVTLLLAEVAVQALGIISVVNQFVGNLLCVLLRTAEDDGEDAGIVVYDTFESQVFVLGIHHIVDVVYVFGTLVAAAYHNLLVVVQIVAGDAFHLTAHGGGEEQGVAVFGHSLEDGVDAFREAHVEHLIGLIEHDVPHLVELCHATVHQVDEATRCGDDNLCAVAQLAYLVLDGGAAVDGHHMDALHILREVAQVVGYLQAEFTCRTEHQCLGGIAAGVDALEYGNAEGGGLAGSGLCQCNHVVAVAEQIGNHFFLYGHGLLESQFLNGAANLFADAQFFKCLQVRAYKYKIKCLSEADRTPYNVYKDSDCLRNDKIKSVLCVKNFVISYNSTTFVCSFQPDYEKNVYKCLQECAVGGPCPDRLWACLLWRRAFSCRGSDQWCCRLSVVF